VTVTVSVSVCVLSFVYIYFRNLGTQNATETSARTKTRRTNMRRVSAGAKWWYWRLGSLRIPKCVETSIVHIPAARSAKAMCDPKHLQQPKSC
jgi:hypothetical protein